MAQEGLGRSPTTSPASAWDKRLVSAGDDIESGAGSPELNRGETLDLDGNAQSVIDGARLISMQLRSTCGISEAFSFAFFIIFHHVSSLFIIFHHFSSFFAFPPRGYIKVKIESPSCVVLVVWTYQSRLCSFRNRSWLLYLRDGLAGQE